MKILLPIAVTLLFSIQQISSQNIGTTTPNASAILDISSNSKGLSIPKLTTADYYSITVSMDTEYVAIGATGQDNATYADAVYVFAFGGGVWNFQQKIKGTVARGQCGFAISLNSIRIAIGAP